MATTRLGSFTVHYHNEEEYHHIKREIFADQSYYFDCSTPDPLIIDAGAHIGLATLYFKKLYPAARIVAFEPNPTSFRLLEQNVWENQLENITCINAALIGDERPTITLHQDAAHQWLMTTSTRPGAWSGEQQTQPIVVPACRLSPYLTEPVALLKLDIEGSERAVLRDVQPQLPKVAHLRMELHATQKRMLQEALTLLKPYFRHLAATKRQLPVEDPAQFVGLCQVAGDQ